MGIALAPGLVHHPGWLDAASRAALGAEVAAVLAAAPAYTPRMPRTDKPFSVRMTNAGPLGWVSDRAGYRYQPHHPGTGARWPPLPPTVLRAWAELAGYPHLPEACLITLYGPEARMGLHQDRDERDLAAPVLSLSLGAPALFRYGGLKRTDPTRSVRLRPGDALVIGGTSRLIFHGIDRILPAGDLVDPGEPALPGLPLGWRLNLTARRVSPPA